MSLYDLLKGFTRGILQKFLPWIPSERLFGILTKDFFSDFFWLLRSNCNFPKTTPVRSIESDLQPLFEGLYTTYLEGNKQCVH